MSYALRLADGIDWLTRAIGRLASALLLGMILLVFFNVAGRYVFGTSPIWMQELEWHLLVPVALLGVTVLMMDNGHVRVDMLYERFPTRVKHAVDCITMLLGVCVSLLFIKYSTGYVANSFTILEGSPDPGGLPGRWVVKGFIPVGFGFLALQCLANAIRHGNAFLNEEG